jgi:hypothetical protein
MFFIDSGDFRNDPFHLVLTLQIRFACFCMYLTFRDLSDVERTQSFFTSFFRK